MTNKIKDKATLSRLLTFRQRVKNQFLYLMIALAGLIFLPSFIESPIIKDLLIYFFLGLVLLIGGLLLSETTNKFIATFLLGGFALVVNVIPFDVSDIIFLSRMISLMMFFLWLMIYVFQRMSIARRISKNIIMAAINGYLLIGILGGFCFRMIYHFDASAFALSDTLEAKLDVFTYFSFVTLTNLGYGDITPVASSSQSIALLLAVSGQMYLAIVIGILVGKFILFRGK